MPYPIILGGDHAAFEQEWAASGRPDNERPDWPLPSFDARDWAAAFCKIANGFGFKDAEGKPIDEGWMITWFANALMRGFDENAARSPEVDVRCQKGCVLRKERMMADIVAELRLRREMMLKHHRAYDDRDADLDKRAAEEIEALRLQVDGLQGDIMDEGLR